MTDILNTIDFLVNIGIFLHSNEEKKFNNTIPENTKNSSQKYTKKWNKIIATKNIMEWETILFLENSEQIKAARWEIKTKHIAWYKNRTKNISFEDEAKITAIKNIKRWEILYLDYPSSNKPRILFPNKRIYLFSWVIFILTILTWIILIGVNSKIFQTY